MNINEARHELETRGNVQRFLNREGWEKSLEKYIFRVYRQKRAR